MAEKVQIKTRLLTASDIPAADRLRDAAGWNQTRDDWNRLITLEPRGCFAAVENGQVMGTATTTTFGQDLAWIGMVLVDPDQRNRGIGRHLLATCLDYLRGKGVHCIKLDATPAGQILYEKLGFRAEWELARWMRPGDDATEATEHASFPTREDWRVMMQLDHDGFGIDRGAFLELLGKTSLQIAVHRTESDFGFGFLRPGIRADYLGPILAENEKAGREIVDQLLSHSRRPLFWDIPKPCAAAEIYARQLGFILQRPLMRMYLGNNSSPGHPEYLWGISDPATG